ncbi:MAG: RNA pseudouridine synthase [Planctomycetota bacterium]
MSNQLPQPNILLERGAVILVNKPGGLLTQAPPGIDSLEVRVKQFLIQRENKPGKAYLGVPHRLDRPVSGVMVVVKNVRAAKRISEQIQARTVNKRYWALVCGHISKTLGNEGECIDFMRKVPGEARSEIVSQTHPDAKNAELNFHVLSESVIDREPVSQIEIELVTGRTHQIRLQLSHRGHAILGDQLYGSTVSFGPQTLDLRKRWIALHARRLGFVHPIDKESVDMTCPLPAAWTEDERLAGLALDRD